MERPQPRLNTQIYEEASEWFVECRAEGLDEADRREFDRWLRKSPEHVSAYLEVAAIWSEGRILDSSRHWDAETLIAEAQRDLDNIVDLRTTGSATSPPEWSEPAARVIFTLPRHRLVAVAASLTVVAAFAGLWASYELSASTYSTAFGEQRSIELADGSTVEINSRSEIRVRYSERERTIDLLEGQALFHVAKNKARPFIVNVDGTRVRAVGTQFDVYRRQGATTITVLEGQVAVFAPLDSGKIPDEPAQSDSGKKPVPESPPASVGSAGSAPSEIPVSAGEQLTVSQKFAQKSEHANVTAATSWTERRIVFESATLSQVAEEFNRYNARQLVIEDPELYPFHISGVFSSNDPESLIRFLRERPGVIVTESASVVRVSKKRP